jgi:mRNA-degrading endonuclease toxin of MazEF toxin-antitoxin module
MSLRRGDLVTVAAKGPYTSKPRPALVIQSSDTLPSGERVDAALRFWLDQ